jgi:hypothetical protein
MGCFQMALMAGKLYPTQAELGRGTLQTPLAASGSSALQLTRLSIAGAATGAILSPPAKQNAFPAEGGSPLPRDRKFKEDCDA